MADKYYDFYAVLQQLGTNVDAKQVDRAAKKVDLNKPNSDRELVLAKAGQDGYTKAVAYLIEKGVKLDAISPRWQAPALALAMTSNSASARDNVQIVKALLDAGANPSTKLEVTPHPRAEKDAFRSGTILDYVIADAKWEHKVATSKSFDSSSRKDAARKVKSYGETIPLVIAAGGAMSPESAKQLKKLGIDAASKATPAKATRLAADWPARVRKLLASTKQQTQRDIAYKVCTEYLSHPDAIASKEWPALVEATITSGRTFEDVANEVYGAPVSFLDDEGWLCQGWENYVVLDHVLELLGTERAAASSKWAALVEKTLAARRKYSATNAVSSTVDDFFARPWVAKQAAFKALRAVEKKTR